MAEQKQTLQRRVLALENIVVAHDAQIEALIESQQRTDRQMAETREFLRELGEKTDKRIEALGERIDKLVSGIGEWIRQAKLEGGNQ